MGQGCMSVGRVNRRSYTRLTSEDNAKFLAVFKDCLDESSKLTLEEKTTDMPKCFQDWSKLLEPLGTEDMVKGTTNFIIRHRPENPMPVPPKMLSEPLLGPNELTHVHAQVLFARRNELPDPQFTVKIEEGTGENRWKLYFLSDLESTLLRGSGTTWTFLVPDMFAKPFLAKSPEPMRIGGEYVGSSKFLTPHPLPAGPGSKEKVLDLLGRRGYSTIDNDDNLYHFAIRVTDEIRKRCSPGSPILYKDWDFEGDDWRPMLHFQSGTIPCYTSGGNYEMVIETFEVPGDKYEEIGMFTKLQ